MLKKIFLTIAFLLCFTNVNAQVIQDNAGTWQIDTFKGEPNFPYLIVTACFNPFDNTYIELSPSGLNDCHVNNIRESKKLLKEKINNILEITKRKYVVSITMSVCHPDWFVIYLHTGKKYVEKEIYDKLWEKLKINNLQ